ncbi:MAG: hypothetical protein C5S48_06065 [Candidatus Methanogaster sp.]|nr:MAG: hypothetical protein C5S48_06065 [ANME-2 cluster archaeon]
MRVTFALQSSVPLAGSPFTVADAMCRACDCGGVSCADVVSHYFTQFPFKLADILRGHSKLDQIIEEETILLSKVVYPLG